MGFQTRRDSLRLREELHVSISDGSTFLWVADGTLDTEGRRALQSPHSSVLTDKEHEHGSGRGRHLWRPCIRDPMRQCCRNQ